MIRNYKDYTYMWWKDGFGKGSREMLFQTGAYGLSAETVTGRITRLGAVSRPLRASEAIIADDSAVTSLPECSGLPYIAQGETFYPACRLEPIDSDSFAVSRILESGVNVQRMDIMYYRFESSHLKGRLEITAFPRHLALNFSLFCPGEFYNAEAKTVKTRFALKLTPGLRAEKQANRLCAAGANGESYIFISEADISFERDTVIFEYPIELEPDTFKGFTVLYTPSKQTADALEHQKNTAVEATDAQTGRRLPAVYNERGYFSIDVSGLTPEGQAQFNEESARKRYEQVYLSFKNNSAQDLMLPVCFEKAKENFPISGLCPFIRDEAGFPAGIAVQLSKNWHKLSEDPGRGYFYAPANHPKRFWEGPWLHAYALIPLSANASQKLIYNCTFASWGGAFAASHAQLCLAGWGGNYQQWESSAIGSFGESFCYDPETAHGRAFMDDIRPLTVFKLNDPNAPRYSWTGCNGGGNFLVYEKEGVRVPLKRVRTWFKKQGPNLCEVIYTAVTQDGCIQLELAAFLPRTDDCSRAVHRFKYTFLKDTSFSRLALYQLGADGYNDNTYGTMAIGNDCGPIDFTLGGRRFSGEFETPLSDKDEYVLTGRQMQRIPVPGRGLFIGFFKAEIEKTNFCKDGPIANRFINLLEYKSVINGVEYAKPAVNIRATHDFKVACAAAELTVPSQAGELIQAGSVIEGAVEYINFPIKKEYYYGPSEVLKSVPAEEFNTFRLAHRACLAGRYICRALEGELIRNYPIAVKVNDEQRAHIIIEGGFSYVPIVFTGLTGFSDYVLERRTLTGWEKIDQSVYGNDFWQCAFDADNGTYELIYNVEHCGEPASEYEYRLRKAN